MKAAPAVASRMLPAAAAVAVIAALAGAGWYGWRELSTRPIEHVAFGGDLARIAPADLEAFAASLRARTVGGVSLASVREAARKIPWVRDASVRRRFPDGIEVRFEAHEPLARWGRSQLVSVRGEVFAAPFDGKLPRFVGPEGSAGPGGTAPQMAEEYAALSRIAAPLASPVAELRLSARGAWQLLLESGLSVDLGRGDIRPRLERFVAAWPGLAARGVRTTHADLRYANGFALRRASEPTPPAKKK